MRTRSLTQDAARPARRACPAPGPRPPGAAARKDAPTRSATRSQPGSGHQAGARPGFGPLARSESAAATRILLRRTAGQLGGIICTTTFKIFAGSFCCNMFRASSLSNSCSVFLSIIWIRTCFSFAVLIPKHFRASTVKSRDLIQRGNRIYQVSKSDKNQNLPNLSAAMKNFSLKSDRNSEDPVFAKFSELDKKEGLLLQFATDLFAAAKSNDGMRIFFEALKPTFAKALQSNPVFQQSISNEMKGCFGPITKNDLIYKVAYNKELDAYMLSFNGRRDSLMVSYAKKYQFPRGCPVLWKRGQFIDIRGFYPKFENDNRETEAGFDVQVFENACGLDFFLKWSGFLIQLFAFEIDSKYYWTVLSKQKADYESPFIQLGQRLLMPLMTRNLTKILADNHLYIGAEGLSPQDNTHGYIARIDAALVTCIGRGTFYNFYSNENIFFDKQIVKYYTNYEIAEFCCTHNLLCDTARYVRGDQRLLSEFTNIVFRRRDFMKFQDFEEMFAEFQSEHPDACRTLLGSADHRSVAGEVLEGMVFGIVYADGSRTTEKVKLPFYTWRTMFLRSWFDELSGRKKAGFGGKSLRNLEFISAAALKRMETFTQYWCSTTQGKMHFLKMMKAAAVILQCDGKVTAAQAVYTEITDDLHVHLANQIEALPLNSLEEKASVFDQILSNDVCWEGSPIMCCFVLGPIGAGKSTFSERLLSEASHYALHIDGDRVIRDDMTQHLHSERADASKAAVYRCILEGRHPVISTGGGVFDGFAVHKQLKDIFKRPVKVIVCMMKDVKNAEESPEKYEIQKVSLPEIDKQLPEIYDTDVQYMQRIVTGRIHRKEWADTKEYSKINDKSKKNIQFAAQLLQQADHIFTVPYDTSEQHRHLPHHIISRKVTGVQKVSSFLQTSFMSGGTQAIAGNFTQIRAIVSRTDADRGSTCKHITLAYDSETFQANISTYKAMEEMLCRDGGTFTADLYGLTGFASGGKTAEIRVAVLRGLSSVPYAHVTETAGPFMPAMMKEVTKQLLDAKASMKATDFKLFKTNKVGESFSFHLDPSSFQTLITNQPKKVGQKKAKNTSTVQTVEYKFVDILLL